MEQQFTILDEVAKLKKKLESEENITISVALFGHSGAGKSSIINKLVGQRVADVDVQTDTTTVSKPYEWNGIYLTDLPGYNTKKFPANEYLEKFKILTNYDLFICVFEGKLSKENAEFFSLLKKKGKICIFVRNKADQIWDEEKSYEFLKIGIEEDLKKQINSFVENVVFTSCRDNLGFDVLQKDILAVLDQSKRSRWIKSSKAYSFDFLEKKKEEARKMTIRYAGISAANGLNPIPGLDVTVDISTLLALFSKIRTIYGLTDDNIEKYKLISPTSMQIGNSILKFATKEGLLILLKRFGTQAVVKQFSKYVPFVGQAIAGTVGFAITKSAGLDYLENCHKLASEILELELNKRN